jgi:hypothetical protein
VTSCAYPKRCGSDGDDCCHPDCEWSSWYALWRKIKALVRAGVSE